MLEALQIALGMTDSPELRELRHRTAKPQLHHLLHGQPVETAILSELCRRMAKPQRHRLLHGYPLAAAMPSVDDRERTDTVHIHPTSNRGLLIGVLPHPCCNAALAGCGFCTFPHEPYGASKVATIVDHVVREIDARVGVEPSLRHRPVTGLYFGGGTANLTPPKSFLALCRKLNSAFDLSEAEITLEGVPVNFIKRKPLLVDILRQELDARHFRVSMGIQTFDPGRLRQMGRLAFGTRQTFLEVVELAHSRGMTVSGDLLFNLPGQSLNEMRQDVRDAMAIGLDHVGLYHLVMFKGLGTVWSRDADLLASLPPNDVAADHWQVLRELLIEGGFTQTTLTNFERSEFQGDARRFVYEESSFQPDRFDMLGFGPSGISFRAGKGFGRAVKVLNPDSSSDYVAAVKRGGRVWDRWFEYGEEDSKISYLTRRLAALEIDRATYGDTFSSDAVGDFSREFEALEAERLVDVTAEAIRPTPRGMFHADSIAGLLAMRRIRALRRRSTAARRVSSSGQTDPARQSCHDANDNSVEYM
jgi:coproporphyrinogen III oxidase-like Fe-S oxidoreductase